MNHAPYTATPDAQKRSGVAARKLNENRTGLVVSDVNVNRDCIVRRGCAIDAAADDIGGCARVGVPVQNLVQFNGIPDRRARNHRGHNDLARGEISGAWIAMQVEIGPADSGGRSGDYPRAYGSLGARVNASGQRAFVKCLDADG